MGLIVLGVAPKTIHANHPAALTHQAGATQVSHIVQQWSAGDGQRAYWSENDPELTMTFTKLSKCNNAR